MPVLGRSTYKLIQSFWTVIDLLYPPRCGGCGLQGARWCQNCQAQAEIIIPPVCDYCGSPQRYQGLCSRCKIHAPPYSSLRSWATFTGPVRNALHQLKYHHNLGLGEALSRKLIENLDLLDWVVNLVVPVPLGIARLRERGYNQSELLAYPLALGAGYCYDKKALSRSRETQSQVGLTASQRKKNVYGAFKADPIRVANQSILIVDDITTSGATIEACATALLDAGAQQVFGLTLARTIQSGHEFLDTDLSAIRDDNKSYQEELQWQ